jgi:hypothetical protein
MNREDAIRIAEDNETLGLKAFCAINEVSAELARAVRKFGPFHSGHTHTELKEARRAQ